MSHCNITMRDRYSAVEQQAELLHLIRAKNERLESLLSAAESNLSSIFERIKDGDEVWLDYPDGSRVYIQAIPDGRA